jgi:hypothetical protein
MILDPQYGQVLVFCSALAANKPPHLLQTTIIKEVTASAHPKTFSTIRQLTLKVRGGEMSSEKTAKGKTSSRLVLLAIRYFGKKGYKVEQEKTTLEGYSGISRKFDLIVQKGRLVQGVWIRDWKRTIGVNVVINLDKASDDVELSNPIIIGEKFSDHAKSYANRRKVTLLTKRQMTLGLR